VDWVASQSTFGEAKNNFKKLKKIANIINDRNKAKHSGQVPHCNFYFVALLDVFLV